MWLYGLHPCKAALENPKRRVLRICVTDSALSDLRNAFKPNHPKPQIVVPKEFEKLLERGAVHQGIAIEVEGLKALDIEQVPGYGSRPLVVLDQVTDPHNVGAILRSCAAFNACAVITQDRHSPNVTGTLAKAASGALEIVPIVTVTNISKTLEQLKAAGYWTVGMDGSTSITFRQAKLGAKTALVMGAEGKGLRRLVAEHCDMLVKLPMNESMESLNVSNAAAIALYELFNAGT
jgi:23S rRNA (guanosine2251-2'-O)-methyltransferase